MSRDRPFLPIALRPLLFLLVLAGCVHPADAPLGGAADPASPPATGDAASPDAAAPDAGQAPYDYDDQSAPDLPQAIEI